MKKSDLKEMILNEKNNWKSQKKEVYKIYNDGYEMLEKYLKKIF